MSLASEYQVRSPLQEQSFSPGGSMQALVESVRVLRRFPCTISLDMKLSEVRSTVNALMPIVSLPVWLPFSFMISMFSYFVAVVVNAFDGSDGGSPPWAAPPKSTELLKQHRSGSMSNLLGTSGNSCPILRALDQVLELVTALPTSSTKYSFTRKLAEQLLKDNATRKPNLLDINRMVLSRAFLRTMDQLTACLLNEARAFTSLNSIIRRCKQVAGWATTVGSATDLAASGAAVALRAEKLSQELSWLADMLFEYGGGVEALRLWAHCPVLEEAARTASPRAQSSLVRLSALLARAVAGTEWTVTAVVPRDSYLAILRRSESVPTAEMLVNSGDLAESSPNSDNASPWAPLDLQYRLLLLWLPLMCRAVHSGDGPILSTSEKQRTEEALQHIILRLSLSEQEVLFSSWLHEYSWSTSDWPNLQPQYVEWCERSRLVANITEDPGTLE